MAEGGTRELDFVPVVADGGSGAAAIEIEIGGAIVRVRAEVELGLLGKVLRKRCDDCTFLRSCAARDDLPGLGRSICA